MVGFEATIALVHAEQHPQATSVTASTRLSRAAVAFSGLLRNGKRLGSGKAITDTLAPSDFSLFLFGFTIHGRFILKRRVQSPNTFASPHLLGSILSGLGVLLQLVHATISNAFASSPATFLSG